MAKIACVGYREGDCENCKSVGICSSYTITEKLYNAGYRKQSVGEWVKVGYGITGRVMCSNCKSEKGSFMRPPFCNQCGAKMKGANDETKNE